MGISNPLFDFIIRRCGIDKVRFGLKVSHSNLYLFVCWVYLRYRRDDVRYIPCQLSRGKNRLVLVAGCVQAQGARSPLWLVMVFGPLGPCKVYFILHATRTYTNEWDFANAHNHPLPPELVL